MELLAPAGSFAAFEAAVTEGADAIYVGAPELNARALARDFTFKEISGLIQYAHRKGVKVYIAMNSLVKENEVSLAIESLAHYDALEADALIIQDLGLLYMARTFFPGLPLHASTLMSAHNSSAVRQLVELECKRIVLPRELTIREISKIYQTTKAELEVFIHGAMCFCYSGLCLFSSLHGGKSSLRGQCVQPCRRQYSWQSKRKSKGKHQAAGKDSGYFFSMNDLCAIGLLPELARAGVKSLKIEGRLKSAEYVRKTVRAYRLILDNIDQASSMKQNQKEANRLLDEAMGRKRSTGFFLSNRPQEAITPQISGNVGVMIGRVRKIDLKPLPRGQYYAVFSVSLRHPVLVGDRLRLHDDKSGERISFSVKKIVLNRRPLTKGKAGQVITVEAVLKLPVKPAKKIQGTLFKVDINAGRQAEKKAREKIVRLQSSSRLPGREQVDSILKRLESAGSHFKDSRWQSVPGQVSVKQHAKTKPQWWVKVSSVRDTWIKLPIVPDKYVIPLCKKNMEYGIEQNKNYHIPVVWSLPPVILDSMHNWYANAISDLIEKKYTLFQVGHWSHISLFDTHRDSTGLSVYGDYTLNSINSCSLLKLHQIGLSGTLFSIETDKENLVESMKRFRKPAGFMLGVYVFGKPPLFTARLDSSSYNYGKRFVSPRGEEYILTRENEMTLARSVLPFDLLESRKEIEKSGIDYFYIDLTAGNIKRNVSEFIGHLKWKGKRPVCMHGNFDEKLV